MDMFKILIEKQCFKKRLYLEVFVILITIKFNKTKQMKSFNNLLTKKQQIGFIRFDITRLNS